MSARVRRVVHDRRRPARDLAEAQLAGLVETLREARVDLGLSPERLGLLAGLSDGSVRMWETGKRQPGFAEVVMWAGALGFEVRIGPAGNMGED